MNQKVAVLEFEQTKVKSQLQPSFTLGWATPREKMLLDLEMGKLGRQRMNLRVMPNAKFILLKDSNRKVIGWGGLDVEFNTDFPELFSLQLDPAYRGLSLGLLIEAVRATYLRERGMSRAFVRMARDTSYRLLAKRLESRFYSELDPRTLGSEYVDLCGLCELHGKACARQVYLSFDVELFLSESEKRFGKIDLEKMSREFFLSSPIRTDLAKREQVTPWRRA
jgi:N-acetylglutamate synthase-like GNAT family acetyltransferase